MSGLGSTPNSQPGNHPLRRLWLYTFCLFCAGQYPVRNGDWWVQALLEAEYLFVLALNLLVVPGYFQHHGQRMALVHERQPAVDKQRLYESRLAHTFDDAPHGVPPVFEQLALTVPLAWPQRAF